MLVSNSSTLILLAKVTVLHSFLETVNKVLIPDEVYKESLENKKTLDSLIIQKYVGNKIIVKKTAKNIEEIKKQFRLDEGEAAAYALYDQKQHDAILTDDRELIKLCKVENIKFVCAIAIIVQLFKIKKITKQECLEKIDNLQHIGRYSQNIITYFKEEVQ